MKILAVYGVEGEEALDSMSISNEFWTALADGLAIAQMQMESMAAGKEQRAVRNPEASLAAVRSVLLFLQRNMGK
ncbi:MAG: hypothetical protein E4H01_15085 [Lysobacterales bacterium]|nr:MAG: hypothetical protein E4H01_15085 [Xanthomonadales bacterium]